MKGERKETPRSDITSSDNDPTVQSPGDQTAKCLEAAEQAHLSENLERGGCSLAVFRLLEAQTSRKTRVKAMEGPGDT